MPTKEHVVAHRGQLCVLQNGRTSIYDFEVATIPSVQPDWKWRMNKPEYANRSPEQVNIIKMKEFRQQWAAAMVRGQSNSFHGTKKPFFLFIFILWVLRQSRSCRRNKLVLVNRRTETTDIVRYLHASVCVGMGSGPFGDNVINCELWII